MNTSLETGPGEAETFDTELNRALRLILDCTPSPCAVTRGPRHTLVHCNPPFRRLLDSRFTGNESAPVTELLPALAAPRVKAILDHAWTEGHEIDEQFVISPSAPSNWNCSVSPLCDPDGGTNALVIELRRPTASHGTLLQRQITERLLLSTLQSSDAAERAETSVARLEFLAKASLVLGMSLSSSVTRVAVAGMSLPIPGTWCIVDLLEADGAMTRLPILHPEPAARELAGELFGQWLPQPGDPFGGTAVETDPDAFIIIDDVDAALAAAAHSPENLRILQQLHIGSLLTTPLIFEQRFLGAVTFVSSIPGYAFSLDEVRLAQALAARNAEALENARVYTEALLQREEADIATRNKLRFLANVSHDLRSPLSAMLGYVELIAEEIHGPITPAQREDLERIRMNQAHLMDLVDELLTYVQKGAPRANQIQRLPAHDMVAASVALIENTMSRKSIHYEHDENDPRVVALGDRDRVIQILVNLIANAVKFTARGGEIATRCEINGDQVSIQVMDTGIGIDSSKFDDIFERFVQVHEVEPAESGVGLGLSISRELARAMHGELTVSSNRGIGSCFTLTLPRAVS